MFQIQRFTKLALIMTILACITALFVGNAAGQEQSVTGQKQLEYVIGSDVKTVLFKDATKALKSARKVQADVLAPKSFGEAMKRYQEANTDLQQGKNLEEIQKKLREASVFFQKAIDATKLAEVSFPNSMKARRDAQYTESAKFSTKLPANSRMGTSMTPGR